MTASQLLLMVNFGACAVIFWVSASFFVSRSAPVNWRELALQFGLAGLMCFSFASAFAPTNYAIQPGWWALGLRVSGALIAVALYDGRFGLVLQMRMLQRWAHNLPLRAKALGHQVATMWIRMRVHR